MSLTFGKRVAATTMLAAAMFSATQTREALAQTAPAGEAVQPTAKGIIGGGLLGAEVVMITEALIGVKPWWAYAIGGGLGAVGGALGGFAIEKNVEDGRIPVFMLAGGLALLIPTAVLTLNATRYTPSESAVEDKAPTNAPAADPGTLNTNSVGAPTTPSAPAVPGAPEAPAAPPAPATPPPAAPPAPGSLFQVSPGQMRVGIPVPEVRPIFSRREQKQFGLQNSGGTEVRVPLVNFAF
jgi:hypothetical protein